MKNKFYHDFIENYTIDEMFQKHCNIYSRSSNFLLSTCTKGFFQEVTLQLLSVEANTVS